MPSVWKMYRIKLHNVSQEKQNQIFKISNTFRYCYNWALSYFNKSWFENGQRKTAIDACTEFTRLKTTVPEFKWLNDYNVATCRSAIYNARNALEKFFEGYCRYPRYKSKKNKEVKFKVDGNRVSFRGKDKRYVHIPGLGRKFTDFLDCKKHKIPSGPNVRYHNVYIKYDGINFWLSMSVELIDPIIKIANNESIGIDVGLRTSATLSNGMEFAPPNPRRLAVLENRKRKIQSAIAKDRNRRIKESERTKTKYEDIKKSNNQVKRERKYQKTLHSITNLYKSHYHKISREIANLRSESVTLESLGLRAMNRDKPHSSKYMIPARLGMLSEFIEYKCRDIGSKIIKAPQNFASTKTCSRCGNKKHIGGEKIYICEKCGLRIDRDLNAAINLRDYGLKVQ